MNTNSRADVDVLRAAGEPIPCKELAKRIDDLPEAYYRRKTDDHLQDECGIFGVFGHEEAATLTYLGLYALQHRGQEGAGIVVNKNGQLKAHRGMGRVSDVFKPHKLARLSGNMAIGHVRYSTFGGSDLKNVQPLPVD
ncbi:MAG: hypothetical protein VCB26_01570, partial [Candidatus Hydrogenedentota bacterium]